MPDQRGVDPNEIKSEDLPAGDLSKRKDDDGEDGGHDPESSAAALTGQ